MSFQIERQAPAPQPKDPIKTATIGSVLNNGTRTHKLQAKVATYHRVGNACIVIERFPDTRHPSNERDVWDALVDTPSVRQFAAALIELCDQAEAS